MLQVLTALNKRRMARQRDVQMCYSFILSQLRTNSYTVIDLAQLANVLGKQQHPFPSPSSVSRDGEVEGSSSVGAKGAAARSGGGSFADRGIGATVAQIVQEIEEVACVHMRDSSLQPRQLASILWMFGRLGIQPSMPEFRGLICVFIRERVRAHACLGSQLQVILLSCPGSSFYRAATLEHVHVCMHWSSSCVGLLIVSRRASWDELGSE